MSVRRIASAAGLVWVTALGGASLAAAPAQAQVLDPHPTCGQNDDGSYFRWYNCSYTTSYNIYSYAAGPDQRVGCVRPGGTSDPVKKTSSAGLYVKGTC